MALKATFTAGSNSTTVTGLYQWDYGQELEIEVADIGSEIVEVHFACSNMSEAIVRPCTFSDGIGSVTIPDACLEQSSTITAWIYEISGTGGHTTKTITMPITARTRPSAKRDIPVSVSDTYTELITQVNEAVNALENGTVTVAKATDAQNASHATSATNAGTANFATTAGSLSTTKQAYSTGGDGKISVTLSPGKAYLIEVSDKAGGTTYETMLLFISRADETPAPGETTYKGYPHYSTKSANGFYCYYFKGELYPRNADNTNYSPTVYIREI